ncbi:MAG: phenylalanine--tRNA ligase subunit beta [Clostridia bacterium]|nr:phenylalanine--tRNA ligase subunit beta [Clostridia bacterium]
MFLSMNWIGDFVDLSGLDKLNLIKQFSLSTAEVENEIFRKGQDISGVVVAEILSCEPHPSSKKLHLLKVDCGAAEPVDVVCGAPNARVGIKTAFARVGAQLGEIAIAPRDLAGYTSYGMCCSERELGISEDHEGIMELDASLPNGTDLKDIFDIDDIIFEVDNKSLTNRPDLWGHYGIAREFAVLANRPLKPIPTADLAQYDGLPSVDIQVEDPLCYRYTGIQVENITKNVSPINMKIRLNYCGQRSINLLADLTNYLMLEMGQPMHAFDARKVDSIRVKRFAEPFKFTTLDGVERDIDENTLMICNGDTPVAIAGIMGGLDSEIVADTNRLTLESANFDAVSIRKSSVRLAHRTDSSARYEKCLDPEMTSVAAARFIKLLQEIDGGVKVVSSLTDVYKYHYPQRVLQFDKRFVDRYTGIEIANDRIEKTLTSLGFGVTADGDDFTVTVPSWRATKDVTIKADIIEEITRIYGYDNFAVNTTLSPLYPIRPDTEKTVEDRIKDILVKHFRLHEVHSYIWAYSDEYRELGIPVEDNVRLANASNPNIEVLRRSMIPNQLCQVRANNQYDTDFGIFEIGRVVDGLNDKGLCDEHKKLGLTLFSKTKTVETLYYGLRDMLALLAEDIKQQDLTFAPSEATHVWQHPKNLNAVICGGETIGEIGVVHPTVAKKIDKKANVVYAEIDVPAFAAVKPEEVVYHEVGKFPEMSVDLNFLTDTFLPVRTAIERLRCPIIRKIGVIDTYKDENGKSITVRIIFGHDGRTLTGEEVKAVTDRLIDDLAGADIALKS